jgi:signal peptidase I
LIVRLLARGYLVLLVALAACATVPMAFGLTGTVVQSGSMMPHIAVGDVVLSRPLAAGAPIPLGRVVTFRAPSGSPAPGIRLHRIVGINPDGSLITAGDANRDVDVAPLDPADIIAVGCLLIPWIGLPAYWLQHTLLLPLAAWATLTAFALIVEFLASRDEAGERRSRHVRAPMRGVRARVGKVGPESALSVLSLVICAVMVAIAPYTPSASAAFTATTNNAASSWVAAVDASPVKLEFATEPSNSTGGIAFGSQPAVSILTSGGGATTSAAPVMLSISTPAGATLSCSANPVAAVAGTAHFSGCRIDKAGTYTLTAASPGLSSAISANITVSIGGASQLFFRATPGNTARNTAFTNQPVVVVQDAGGNTVTTSSIPITLSIVSGALICNSNPKNAVAGVAAFAGCRINQTGSYVFTATSGSLRGVSPNFYVFSVASKLVFLASPSTSSSSAAFASQPVVAIKDGTGNTTSGTNPITLTITTPAGATLSCASNPQAAANGTATFSGCAIGKAGTYTLTATTGGLASATSASFTVTAGPAARLSFTSSPSNSISSTAFSAQPVVAVLDAFGNSTTSVAPVSLTISAPAGASLACASNPTGAVSGVAVFSGCRIDRAGSYTLTATSTGIAPAVSGSFSVAPGAASRLVFSTSPVASAHGAFFPIDPVVTVVDSAGNPVPTLVTVSLAITAPTGGAHLSCLLNPWITTGASVSFSLCSIDRAGAYTITASSPLLISAQSATFLVS